MVICGAVEVGVIWTTLFGIVTDWATGIVAPDAISPITTLTLSTLTSFVAASTDAAAWVCPSSDATSLVEMPVCLTRFSDSFWRSTAILTAWSRFAPYAARSPVKGRTLPILSWKDTAACSRSVPALAEAARTHVAPSASSHKICRRRCTAPSLCHQLDMSARP